MSYSTELVFIGIVLPALFSFTLVIEGIYKIHKHEERGFTFILGILFLIGLATCFYILF